MAKIKYGQIGVGHGHATKIEVYRESDEYEVVGLVEPDESLHDRIKSQPAYRDVPLMTEEQLLNTPGLEVVGVETRVRNQIATAQRCVDAGMHVHLEKPGGASLPKLDAVLDQAAKKHLVVQLGYMYRYNPAILLLREFLSKGWLGDVFEVHAVMSKQSPAPARLEMAEFTGGTMFELGCHLIDLLHIVLGAPEKVIPYPRHSGNFNDALNDNMLAVFEYPKATATIRSSLIEYEGFARRHLAVCGTHGTLHIQPLDNPSVRLALTQNRGKYERGYQDVTFPKYSRYVGDAADLAKIIRNEKDPDLSYEHDREVLRTVLLASGMPIDH